MKSWASGTASRLDGTFLNLALFFAAVMSTASRSNRCAKKATSTPLEIIPSVGSVTPASPEYINVESRSNSKSARERFM